MWIQRLSFCRNNGWIMEYIDKVLTVQKWMLIVWTKITQMLQNLSAQFVCPSPKAWDFNVQGLEKGNIIQFFSNIWSRYVWTLDYLALKPFLDSIFGQRTYKKIKMLILTKLQHSQIFEQIFPFWSTVQVLGNGNIMQFLSNVWSRCVCCAPNSCVHSFRP